MRSLIRKYNSKQNYTLLTDSNRGYISSTLVVMVIDEQSTVIEAYSLGGLTIFSRFKAIDSIKGIILNEKAIDYINENLKEKLSIPITRIVERYFKMKKEDKKCKLSNG